MIYLLIALLAVSVGCLACLLFLLRRDTSGAAHLGRLAALGEASEKLGQLVREDLARGRTEGAEGARQLREELSRQLSTSRESDDKRLETLRSLVDQRLRDIQEDNTKKLDQMRLTVSEKLEGALERRLGESFRLVSERLELVHKGLGEMQTLAHGVGDLKRVLSNVKTRGTWGEVLLGNLLDQILTPEQYEKNVVTQPGGTERVEFAIKLPGREGDSGRPVWLPIDSKCPQDDYLRLVEASERGDAEGVRASIKQLEIRLKASAKDIHDKHIAPPHTTDFAILFAPTEGLYAEALRCPGLTDDLQQRHRVMIAGPTTLAALLNSLQMGFRTLAIEKRSSEVWSVLSAVKTEFGRFGEVFERVKKKLTEAANTIEDVSTRTRAMDRKLKEVDTLPAEDTAALLGVPPTIGSSDGNREDSP